MNACLVFGSAFTFTLKGDPPDLVFILTAPEVRLPCSADGIPTSTVIDSMLSTDMFLTSIPFPTTVVK